MFSPNATHMFRRQDIRSVYERPSLDRGFELTVDDRAGIERLLRQGRLKRSPTPELLEGFLRHKLRISRGAVEPAPADLVVSGRLFRYMVSGEGAREGFLAMEPGMPGDSIPVATFLGATLIGMRALQKMPLLTADGRLATVFVLDVSPVARPELA